MQFRCWLNNWPSCLRLERNESIALWSAIRRRVSHYLHLWKIPRILERKKWCGDCQTTCSWKMMPHYMLKTMIHDCLYVRLIGRYLTEVPIGWNTPPRSFHPLQIWGHRWKFFGRRRTFSNFVLQQQILSTGSR